MIAGEISPSKILADRFRKMADDIERNAGAGFGGAFVVVPPEGGGEPFEQLFVTDRQDPSDFWVLLSSKCKTAITAVDQAARNQQAGFARR
jgi:hypothetical protein